MHLSVKKKPKQHRTPRPPPNVHHVLTSFLLLVCSCIFYCYYYYYDDAVSGWNVCGKSTWMKLLNALNDFGRENVKICCTASVHVDLYLVIFIAQML